MQSVQNFKPICTDKRLTPYKSIAHPHLAGDVRILSKPILFPYLIHKLNNGKMTSTEITFALANVYEPHSNFLENEKIIYNQASTDWKIIYLYKIKKNEKVIELLINKYDPLKNKFKNQIKKYSFADFEADYYEIFLISLNYIDFSKIKNPSKFSFSTILSQQCQKYINSTANKKENQFLPLLDSYPAESSEEHDFQSSSHKSNNDRESLFKEDSLQSKIIKLKRENPSLKKKEIAKILKISVFALSRYIRNIKESIAGAGLASTKLKITSNQKAILDTLQKHPGIKQKDICTELGFTKSTVSREIGRLKTMGLLKK